MTTPKSRERLAEMIRAFDVANNNPSAITYLNIDIGFLMAELKSAWAMNEKYREALEEISNHTEEYETMTGFVENRPSSVAGIALQALAEGEEK